ncbi:TOBE domain-containing protein [Campylobacter majalis]|uniref:TOBE domain-containing protein n=1 Tax=Campylobacter majalis TaxID=2790656 RepID=UPI003D684643
MIRAKVKSIDVKDGVSLVVFNANNTHLVMLSLENIALKIDQDVMLNAKSSDVFVAKSSIKNSSINNELKCKITNIRFGEILSVLSLDFDGEILQSMITTRSALTLNLKQDDEIFAYIKSTSLYISEIL